MFDCINDDIKQRIESIILFFANGFRLVMATLLAFFVKRNCNDHECSLYESITMKSKFNLGVIIFNFITLFIFICTYIYEIHREHIYIYYLDIDNKITDDNLENEIKDDKYFEIEQKITQTNTTYYYLNGVMLLMHVINIVLSFILVMQYYAGYTTLISMITYVILLGDKMYSSIKIAHVSYFYMTPCSAFMTRFVVYNTIDKKFKKNKRNEPIEDKFNGTKLVLKNFPHFANV